MSIDSAIATSLGSDDPRRIGPFEIIGLLGAGGMGEVYLGVTGGRYAAVKLVRPQMVSAERFQREVGILYRIPADVAPRVLASDGTASRPWLASEYVPGLTVDAAVRMCGRLDRGALWLLLAEVAGALSVVHEAGVVHRDLNAANVMLVRGGVKLIDFGIARAAGQARLTKAGAGYGTCGFAAPEQDEGAATVTASADVYSLGALLVYAATGHAPGAELDIEPVRAVDAGLALIVESCLAWDAAKRPTAAELVDRAREYVVTADPSWPPEAMKRIATREAFVEALVSKAETVPPPPGDRTESRGTPAPPMTRAAAWLRRRRNLVVVVPVAVLIVVGGVTAFVLVPFGSPARPDTRAGDPHKPVLSHPSVLPSSTRPKPSPSASVTVTVPDTPRATTASPLTRGPAGPSGDQNYVAGSQVAVPGCAGWMDNNSDLYGTVSAGDASCSAEDIRTNSNVMSPGTVTFQASKYSEANGSGPVFYFIGYQFTEQVCIWNQSDPSVKACTSRYTDKSGTISKD